MTDQAEVAGPAAETPGTEPGPFYGRVIIEWPPPRDGHPLPGWGCAIFDADSGRPITTVSEILIPAVRATAEGLIAAELTMFADPEGEPVLFPRDDGNLTIWQDGNGDIKTATFPFLVAEMRVRQRSQPPAEQAATENRTTPGRG